MNTENNEEREPERNEEPSAPRAANAVTILGFEAEDVKRIRLVRYTIEGNGHGLVVIGGKSGQGKTSVLDALLWTLGGDKFKPTDHLREGATKLHTRIDLSNGLVVERKGKNGQLHVTAPGGLKGGQTLLDGFINKLSINLRAFLNAREQDRSKMLLDQLPGLGEKVAALAAQEKTVFEQRRDVGRDVTRLDAAFKSMPFHADAPAAVVSVAEVIAKRDAATAHNEQNRQEQEKANRFAQAVTDGEDVVTGAAAEVERISALLGAAEATLENQKLSLEHFREERQKQLDVVDTLQDTDLAPFTAAISNAEAVNTQVRDNVARAAKAGELSNAKIDQNRLSTKLDAIRSERLSTLSEAKMPLGGLTVGEDANLLYNGQRWDGMSGSEQLIVATAICRAMRPECGFVLVDGLEKMDADTLRSFGVWAYEQGIQVIGTRVSTGDECSLVIEDGTFIEATAEEVVEPVAAPEGEVTA